MKDTSEALRALQASEAMGHDAWRFALFGPGEFSPWSDDLFAEGGVVAILAPALRVDSPIRRAAGDRFRLLGMKPMFIDVDDAEAAGIVDEAAFVYLQGGNPAVIVNALQRMALWEKVIDENRLATTSGGAMALGELTVDLQDPSEWVPGLGVLPGTVIAAHWDTLQNMAPDARTRYEASPLDMDFIGVEEETALVGDHTNWEVLGTGHVELRRRAGVPQQLSAGDTFSLT
jgi:hypothetical protein